MALSKKIIIVCPQCGNNIEIDLTKPLYSQDHVLGCDVITGCYEEPEDIQIDVECTSCSSYVEVQMDII